jgi:hypothetical protein
MLRAIAEVVRLQTYFQQTEFSRIRLREMTDHESCPACNSWWRLPLLLAIVLAVIVLIVRPLGRDPSTEPPQTLPENIAVEPNAQNVRLTIDFGDDREPITTESRWHEGMTVADLLNGEPSISVTSTGSDASAFLTSLGGVANEGAGGRNWTYRVNDKHADRSFAVYELQPGDQVLWTFAIPQ